MDRLNRITADQARESMPNKVNYLERYMRNVYTQIALRAKNGYNFYVLKSLYYGSKMKIVIDMLREDGYKVEYNSSDDEFMIKW